MWNKTAEQILEALGRLMKRITVTARDTRSSCEIPVGGCPSDPEGGGQLSDWFTSSSEPAELFLTVAGQLVRLGRWQLAGAPGFSRGRAAFAAEFEFQFSQRGYDRRDRAAGRGGCVDSFA